MPSVVLLSPSCTGVEGTLELELEPVAGPLEDQSVGYGDGYDVNEMAWGRQGSRLPSGGRWGPEDAPPGWPVGLATNLSGAPPPAPAAGRLVEAAASESVPVAGPPQDLMVEYGRSCDAKEIFAGCSRAMDTEYAAL